MTGAGLWIALIVWFVQGHAPQRLPPDREIRLRSQTDAVLASWDGARAGMPGSGKTAPVVVNAGLSPVQTADNVDREARRVGLSQVTLNSDSRPQLYWAVFELLKRGYSPDEVGVLIRTKNAQPDAAYQTASRF